MRGDGSEDEPGRPGADGDPPPGAADPTPALLATLLHLLGRPADAASIAHEHGRAGRIMSEAEILRCAKAHDVKARAMTSTVRRLDRLPLPALAGARDGGWFILGAARDGKALIQAAESPRPVELTEARLAERWSGRLILLATRETIAGARRSFDVSWFIPPVVRFRRILLSVLIGSLMLQVLALVSPLFMQVVVDKVLTHQVSATLDVIAIGLAGVILFENLLSGLRTWLFTHTANRIDVELGARTFRHLLGVPLAYFQAPSRRVGHSVARMRELESIRQFLTGNALTLVIDLLFTVVFFGVMLLYSPLLTLVVAASIPLFAGIVLAFTPELRRRIEEKFNRGAESQSFLVESVAGIETIKSMAVEPQIQRRWEEKFAASVRSAFDVSALANVGSHLIQTVARLTGAAILWFGAHQVIGGELTVGQFIAFNMLSAHAIQPILRMANMWPDYQGVKISIARLGDILNTPAEPAWTPGRMSMPRIEGRIEFQGVTYRYRADLPEALRRVSVTIQPGEVVAVVGPSGSGKSTLGKLIDGLATPESGRILIDGIDIALADKASLRRQIGVVPQESVLFAGTVRENIALADPGASLDKVMAAAKLAAAHAFILELPQGYDTPIEERGSNLSGGQRQRIAIARALLCEPRILVLDEATSALDMDAEETIQRNMAQIVAGRTVIVIAHRPSALRICTRLLRLERGVVTCAGDHGLRNSSNPAG